MNRFENFYDDCLTLKVLNEIKNWGQKMLMTAFLTVSIVIWLSLHSMQRSKLQYILTLARGILIHQLQICLELNFVIE